MHTAHPEGLSFPDRRSGPRRTADLPRRKWPDIVISVGLGVLTAVAWQALRGPDANAADAWLAGQIAVVSGEQPPRRRSPAAENEDLDPETLATWRRQADTLTAASVALDERARERWIPRLEALEGALLDAATPESKRIELAHIEARLLATGVVEPPSD